MMRAFSLFIVVSGIGVWLAIIAVVCAAAFLRQGHPPSSTILVPLILLVVTPISTLAWVSGMFTVKYPTNRLERWALVAFGVHSTYLICVITLLVVKVYLGASF